MDDDKIKALLRGFDPELSSDFQFMRNLNLKMDEMEDVMEMNRREQRRGKFALVIASVVGFMTGIAFALIMPGFMGMISHLKDSSHLEYAGIHLLDILRGLSLVAAAGIPILLTINAYVFSLSQAGKFIKE